MCLWRNRPGAPDSRQRAYLTRHHRSGGQPSWKRAKIYNVSVVQHLGKDAFGAGRLRQEGVKIHFAVRWPGKASSLKARFKKETLVALSATFAVTREGTSTALKRTGYKAKAFEDVRLEGMRCRCCFRDACCAVCANERRADQHKFPVQGRLKGKDQTCTHSAAPTLGAARRPGECASEGKGGQTGRHCLSSLSFLCSGKLFSFCKADLGRRRTRDTSL